MSWKGRENVVKVEIFKTIDRVFHQVRGGPSVEFERNPDVTGCCAELREMAGYVIQWPKSWLANP